MRRFQSLASTLAALAMVTTTNAQTVSNVTTPSLNLTTITAHNGRSAYECWQLPDFEASATAGISGALNLFLGEAANASFTVLPPRFNGGAHTAPAPQLVYFTSGLIHLTLPDETGPSRERRESIDTTESVWIYGGKYGLILALDTADMSADGHVTTYPGAADTVALQVPFSAEGYQALLQTKRVLYPGGCQEPELTGL